MIIKFKPFSGRVIFPQYATDGSAGFDLVAFSFKKYILEGKITDLSENTTVISMYPGSRLLVGLGFSVAIPQGFEMQIRPRSGLALNKGITVLNSPGTIDSDYREEVGVILINHSKDEVRINLGDKIAQGVIASVVKATWETTDNLDETERKGGFGSTDKIIVPDWITKHNQNY